MRENIALINDRLTLEEMLTFVRSEKGRAEAQGGAHDDLVMALAIAYYIREQQFCLSAQDGSDVSVSFFTEADKPPGISPI
jgi:phage terminase large subunit